MPDGTGNRAKISVVIADDHQMVREGLREALNREPDISVVGEASDGLEAEELVLRFKPDVLITDIFMPRRDGIDTMVSVKRKFPGIRVLALTVSEREEELFQAIRFGADGYLLKKSDLQEVIDAVRKIAAGEAILSPKVTDKVMQEFREVPGVVLSDREQEVLRLVAVGLSNHEIAERLVLSPGTVSVYIYRLIQKLRLKNRAELIAYSLSHRTSVK